MRRTLGFVALLACMAPGAALACKCNLGCGFEVYVGKRISKDTSTLMLETFGRVDPAKLLITVRGRDGRTRLKATPVQGSSTQALIEVPAAFRAQGKPWYLDIRGGGSSCSRQEFRGSYQVSSTARPALSGVTMALSEAKIGKISVPGGARCRMSASGVQATVTATLPSPLSSFAGALKHEWLVDGKRYTYKPSLCSKVGSESQMKAARVLHRELVANCQGRAPGTLSTGSHKVQLRLFWADDPKTQWTSQPKSVFLTCDKTQKPPVEVTPKDVTPKPPEPKTEVKTPELETPTPKPTPEAKPKAAPQEIAPTSKPPAKGCATTPADTPSSPWALAFLLGVLGLRRRLKAP